MIKAQILMVYGDNLSRKIYVLLLEQDFGKSYYLRMNLL